MTTKIFLWIPPLLAILGSFLAGAVALLSILTRDNEHGIATFFGLVMHAPGLMAFTIYAVLTRHHAFVAAHPLFSRYIPIAFLVIAAILIYITLYSPYGFLYD